MHIRQSLIDHMQKQSGDCRHKKLTGYRYKPATNPEKKKLTQAKVRVWKGRNF